MPLELVLATAQHAVSATSKAISLIGDASRVSNEVIFRRTDLEAVVSSIGGLKTTLTKQAYTLDVATQTRLADALFPSINNWLGIAKDMVELLDEYRARDADGQVLRKALFWQRKKSSVERLRKRSEECKGSMVIAIQGAIACVQGSHFLTLRNHLRGIHDSLEANHQEALLWLQGIDRRMESNHREVADMIQHSEQTGLVHHTEAVKATHEVFNLLLFGLAAIGILWCFWSWTSKTNHKEVKNLMKQSSWMNMENHNEAMKATHALGQKIDRLVTGLLVTGLVILVVMTAAGGWWYFLKQGYRVAEEHTVTPKKEGATMPESKGPYNPRTEEAPFASEKVKPMVKPKPRVLSKPQSLRKPKPEATALSFISTTVRKVVQTALTAQTVLNRMNPSSAGKMVGENTASTSDIGDEQVVSVRKVPLAPGMMAELKQRLDRTVGAGVAIGT